MCAYCKTTKSRGCECRRAGVGGCVRLSESARNKKATMPAAVAAVTMRSERRRLAGELMGAWPRLAVGDERPEVHAAYGPAFLRRRAALRAERCGAPPARARIVGAGRAESDHECLIGF